MFGFIKNKLKNIYNAISSKLGALFSSKKIDAQTLEALERILIEADTGVATTRTLIQKLKTDFSNGTITDGTDLRNALERHLYAIATEKKYDDHNATVYLLVGINGSGKTTTAAKLAYTHKNKGKRVLFAAADTFRAAATEQINEWAQRLGIDIITGKPQQDPASVVFQACEAFKKGGYDTLIIDTAGRLQTKTNLMRELEKIGRIVSKQLPDATTKTLVTIDAMLGQNSFDQARLFNESTKLDGIVLTKLDGTGKGGIVFAIAQELHVPVAFITFGEQPDQIKPFNAQEYVHDLVNS